MLSIPQLAEVAFARLAAEAEARDALTDQYVEMARQAMLTHKPYRRTNSLSAVSNSLRRTSLLDPAEYLVRQAHKKGILDKLLNEFVPQLRQSGADDQAEKLIALADMYKASPDRFFSAADSFLSNSATKGFTQGQGMAGQKGPVRIVINAYLTGNPGNDRAMGQFILDKIREDIDQGRFVHQHMAESWLKNLMSRDKASAKAFLDSVLALYSSPKGRISGLDGHFKSYSRALDNSAGTRNRIQSSSVSTRLPRPTSERNRSSRTRRTRRSTDTRRRSRTR
jgi:hypothetical protein